MTMQSRKAACIAFVHEDDERFTLEIELLDDRAVTLVYWKNGQTPEASVGIWTGRGEHDHGEDSLDSFKEWAEIAVGRKPAPERGPYTND